MLTFIDILEMRTNLLMNLCATASPDLALKQKKKEPFLKKISLLIILIKIEQKMSDKQKVC